MPTRSAWWWLTPQQVVTAATRKHSIAFYASARSTVCRENCFPLCRTSWTTSLCQKKRLYNIDWTSHQTAVQALLCFLRSTGLCERLELERLFCYLFLFYFLLFFYFLAQFALFPAPISPTPVQGSIPETRVWLTSLSFLSLSLSRAL